MSEPQQFCSFFVDGYFFGIPVASVQEILQPQPITWVPLAPAAISGLVNLRGQILLAVDLRRRLGFEERRSDQLPMHLVIRSGQEPVSLLVDEVGEVVCVERLIPEKPPGTLRGFARDVVQGIFQTPQQLLAVLDVDRIIDFAGSKTQKSVATSDRAAELS